MAPKKLFLGGKSFNKLYTKLKTTKHDQELLPTFFVGQPGRGDVGGRVHVHPPKHPPLFWIWPCSLYIGFPVYPADTNSKHIRSSSDNFMLLQELIALQPNIYMTAVSWFKSFFTPKQFFKYAFFWASCLP